jgi:hypothetical protein
MTMQYRWVNSPQSHVNTMAVQIGDKWGTIRENLESELFADTEKNVSMRTKRRCHSNIVGYHFSDYQAWKQQKGKREDLRKLEIDDAETLGRSTAVVIGRVAQFVPKRRRLMTQNDLSLPTQVQQTEMPSKDHAQHAK